MYDPSNFKRLVIAGNLREFELFLKGYDLNPADYTYVSSPEKLRGIHYDNCMIIRVGTWWKNEVYKSMYMLRLEKYVHSKGRLSTIETKPTKRRMGHEEPTFV